MTRQTHAIYIWTMVLVGLVVSLYIGYIGYSYYVLPLEERFYHPRYDWFKPSGLFGQGLGVIGTSMILFGVVIYIAHKRYNVLGNKIRLKYLLEFHIFLCALGPVLILFHTTFKFGGIVSVAFWSMVAVVLSGIVGRFIYIQIPRNIQGKSLSKAEAEASRLQMIEKLKQLIPASSPLIQHVESNINPSFTTKEKLLQFREIKKSLFSDEKAIQDKKQILRLLKQEVALSRKIGRLEQMQKLFKYWHVAHMPFALIMLIIVVIHVIVTISLGYKWIF